MFGFEKIEQMLDDIKTALPMLKESLPQWQARIENLEAEMLRIGNENNRLLQSILLELERSSKYGR